MAARTSRKKNDAQLAFEALSIEGGLLSPEWLSKVAQLGASHQSEADYGIRKGLSLRDELGRYWRIAQAEWAEFDSGRRGGGNPLELAVKFAQALLKECFGFASLTAAGPVTIADRLYPLRFHAVGGRVPIVVAPAGSGLDTPSADFGDGTRKRSAFGLTQEYLNAEEKAVWGIATDGLSLRIVRDNASLTRPAWIEVDLGRLFAEARYADFTALWLLMHESRFGREGQAPTECALEQWRTAGREQGTRARDLLRDGVQDALVALGQGFLSQRDNQALRDALKNGSLTERAYFQQLLRLVYRLIFLVTAEERDLLFAPDAPDAAKQLYAEGYGLRRLRERSAKRRAHDRFTDLYTGLRIVFRGLEAGQPVLGLPALAGLFSAGQTPALDGASLENHSLLEAVFRLSWIREGASLSRVNWRDMGPEELGSVYESLLELVPVLTSEGRVFGFASADESKGNARKTTGSYYTPDSLVQVLLDSALEPVVQRTIATNPGAPVAALLKLSIVDPACGSGHFLLSAARRLAAHVARLEANGTPSPKEYRHALRRVVGQCIFGVDLNPMALELCRLALWMEAVDPGKPLSFLDSHLQQGNALIGATPALMANGVPDVAWEPIDGDDKKTASLLKKRNNSAGGGQRGLDTLWSTPSTEETQAVLLALAELEASPDVSLEALAQKESQWSTVLSSTAYQHQKFVADAWCAAFVWEKQPGELAESAPTNDLWRQLRDRKGQPPALTKRTVSALAEQYGFFHWHLQFAQVFAAGGFDIVVGNPPWDAMSPDAKEFFSRWDPTVRFQAPDAQRTIIERLQRDPVIESAWIEHCRALYNSVAFMKSSGRYRLFAPGNLGKGDFNVYRMFVETALSIVRKGGRVSQVVPEGLYNGANCMKIREELFERCTLELLLGFENFRHVWFDAVDTRAKFAIYVAQVPGRTDRLRVAFNIRSHAELRLATNDGALEIPVGLVREFSPDALALMEFRAQRDVDIAAKMYAAHPKFGDRPPGAPTVTCVAEVHMGNDRELFAEDGDGLPLIEGRHISQFDYCAKAYQSGRGRAAVWTDLPHGNQAKRLVTQWRIPEALVPTKLHGRHLRFRACFCKVTSPTNERTLIAAVVPGRTLCGDSIPTVLFADGFDWLTLAWVGVANSFALDYIARMKTSLNLTFTVLDSLPFPQFQRDDPCARFIVSRVARLVCGTPEMSSLWKRLLSEGWVEASADPNGRGKLDEGARQAISAELDACVARDVFGLTRDQLASVLDTFPIVKRRDEEAHGEYRTRRVILEIYDAMAAASKSGKAYQTVLSPPPDDPSVAHPDTRKAKR